MLEKQDAPADDILTRTIESIEADQLHELVDELNTLPESALANLLESIPPDQREILWNSFSEESQGEVLPALHDEARGSILGSMESNSLISVVQAMPAEDAAEIIDELPGELSETVLDSLDVEDRQRVESVLTYDEDSAGRLMRLDALSVGPYVTLGVVARWLRKKKGLPLHTDALMVADQTGKYLGRLTMEALVIGDADSLVDEYIDDLSQVIQVSTSKHEVAEFFDRRGLVSVAVVDDTGTLLGRITFEEANNVLKEEADQALLKNAGLSEEEDLFAPAIPSAKRRGVWLGLNLITVFLAAWVVSQYEEILSQLVALAILMPIVASMGGIAGSQTLTLTIRGMALNQIARGNVRWLTTKELTVGALNGAVWALIVSLVTFVWFKNIGLAMIIAAAMMLNILTAAVCGIGVPLVLKRLGIDPALSGAVILTTVTDIVGFVSFLSLATIFLS